MFERTIVILAALPLMTLLFSVLATFFLTPLAMFGVADNVIAASGLITGLLGAFRAMPAVIEMM